MGEVVALDGEGQGTGRFNAEGALGIVLVRAEKDRTAGMDEMGAGHAGKAAVAAVREVGAGRQVVANQRPGMERPFVAADRAGG